MNTKQAKKLNKYANKWVALRNGEILESGTTLVSVKNKIEKRKVRNYVFHFVPLLKHQVSIV
jgi:hypothetical protein